ncbi:hypothetical protein BpHYR1_010134 [Brachionus plicatilis]|uniref:Uncharacterized protein n=1 Tax=Brachionus plicatilis TaxID=10195 RepID=A0A3M7R9H5_BRAPC|nr:hypothetical protein BpHYR1_010134 [Brachionus plicatilis]
MSIFYDVSVSKKLNFGLAKKLITQCIHFRGLACRVTSDFVVDWSPISFTNSMDLNGQNFHFIRLKREKYFIFAFFKKLFNALNTIGKIFFDFEIFFSSLKNDLVFHGKDMSKIGELRSTRFNPNTP